MGSRGTYVLGRLGSVTFKLFTYSHRSPLCQLWPCGCQPVCQACCRIREYCGCCLKKWSGRKQTNRTGGYGTAVFLLADKLLGPGASRHEKWKKKEHNWYNPKQ